jgi:hypothetical protein
MTGPEAGGRSPGTRATDVVSRVNAWNRPMMALAGAMAVLAVVTAAGVSPMAGCWSVIRSG